ncbi:ABC transporter ATP-binding protein [Pseudoalteromonas luteoviolacea]|uniref:ABC transporter ATP-binding protein n=1 Tax=Pseudoalteromonas luteoviolacea TaxID=43657 RepID=A0A1C0TPP3_9GAMM|nr:ATP-binding cassette domain-containing protein [Pseudoalteromonas luteoviolacea]MBQ4811690.1 sugar ABC transporter ATP-binding protein [Pseudoalteromonas luteoviolacea]OCQ20740.1 ABC transporter ATP-binding protein [Pseudoalteromonas luteoviolacea]
MIRTALDQIAIQVVDLHKYFDDAAVLRGVDFTVHRGEVVALLGDNGAGKSTLVNCIAGKLLPTRGEIQIMGSSHIINSPHKAQKLGISVVYQDLALIKEMTVVENLFLNREIKHRNQFLKRLGWLDKKAMRQRAKKLLRRLGSENIELEIPVSKLSGGQQQIVALVRSVISGADIIVMDEPTAALGNEQCNQVIELIRLLSTQGVTIILISHNLGQVTKLCDRAVVLCEGQTVADVAVKEVDQLALLALMSGVEPNRFSA